MAEAPRRIEIPLTVEHDGETVEIGRLCYVREDVAERENAELRELLRVAITYCVNGYCGKDDGCPLRLTDYDCQLLTKASELGVEVTG